jgi:hypothetical protein
MVVGAICYAIARDSGEAEIVSAATVLDRHSLQGNPVPAGRQEGRPSIVMIKPNSYLNEVNTADMPHPESVSGASPEDPRIEVGAFRRLNGGVGCRVPTGQCKAYSVQGDVRYIVAG